MSWNIVFGRTLHVQFARSVASPNNLLFFLHQSDTNSFKDIVIADAEEKKSSITLMTFSFFRFSSASHFSQPWTTSCYRRKHYHSSNVSCDWVPNTSREMEKIIQSVSLVEGEVQQQRAVNFTSSQKRLGRVHLLSKKPFGKS